MRRNQRNKDEGIPSSVEDDLFDTIARDSITRGKSNIQSISMQCRTMSLSIIGNNITSVKSLNKQKHICRSWAEGKEELEEEGRLC